LFAPLQKQLGFVPAGSAIVYGDTRTLNYPALLAPLITPRFWATSAAAVGLVCAVARAQAVAWLRRAKVRDLAGVGLLLLLLVQEWSMNARLTNDFRGVIDNSAWGVVDRYIVSYLRNAKQPATSSPPTTSYVHAFHGFGANSLSWRPLLDALSSSGTGATPEIVAHDTPGFGFTPRPRDAAAVAADGLFPAIYRPIWGARASLALGGRGVGGARTDRTATSKHIFLGHSMGAVSAIAAAAAAAASVPSAANVTVVLVAPAFSLSSQGSAQQRVDTDAVLHAVKAAVDVAPAAPAGELSSGSSNRGKNALVAAVARCWRGVLGALQWVWRLPLVLLLRRAVHSDWFWRQGLGAAWGSSAPSPAAPPETSPRPLATTDVFRYKLASMAARFDDDLFRFVAAQRPAQPGSFPSVELVPGVSQAAALAALVQKGARVVVLHGTADRVVPIGVSLRMMDAVLALAPAAQPGSFTVVPMSCFGHLPHEENAAFLLDILKDLKVDF
jgi:alpha-beta hydrolase superfamily lysophospholipase